MPHAYNTRKQIPVRNNFTTPHFKVEQKSSRKKLSTRLYNYGTTLVRSRNGVDVEKVVTHPSSCLTFDEESDLAVGITFGAMLHGGNRHMAELLHANSSYNSLHVQRNAKARRQWRLATYVTSPVLGPGSTGGCIYPRRTFHGRAAPRSTRGAFVRLLRRAQEFPVELLLNPRSILGISFLL